MNNVLLVLKLLRNVGLSSNSDDNISCLVLVDLSTLDILGLDLPALDWAGTGFDGVHAGNLLTVVDVIVEVRGAPAEVVVELFAERIEARLVRESDKAVVGVEVVEEGEVRAGVAESCHVFEVGNLHMGAREEHTLVPGELLLTLNEEDTGLDTLVVEGDSNGKRGGTEAHANKVVITVGESLEAVKC